jgi:methionyl-tRNA synthetase
MATNNNLGLDLLWIFRELLIKGNNKMGSYSDAVARYLLIHLGLSIEDTDAANRLFWQRIKAGTLGDLGDAAARIADFVKALVSAK